MVKRRLYDNEDGVQMVIPIVNCATTCSTHKSHLNSGQSSFTDRTGLSCYDALDVTNGRVVA